MVCHDSFCTVTLLITGQGGRGNFVEIFNSINSRPADVASQAKVSPQGHLVILEARGSHAGQYLCHVSNGVGQPLHTIVEVVVKVPPKITPDRSRINTAIKDPHVKLVCTAEGDRPITVKWTKVRH